MGCNCATQEQLKELYDKYGAEKNKKVGGKIGFRRKVQKVAVFLTMIVVTPFLLIYVFTRAFDDDKRIDIQKFFRLKNNVINTNVG